MAKTIKNKIISIIIIIIVILSIGIIIKIIPIDNQKNTETYNNNKINSSTIAVGSIIPSFILETLEANVVGIPVTSGILPEQYINLPTIGSVMEVDFEKLIELNPDYFITDIIFKEKLEANLDKFNIKSFFIDTKNLTTLTQSIISLGNVLDKQDQAETLADSLENPLKNIQDKINADNKKSVAIMFGSSQSNLLADKNSYIGNIVDKLGIENITDDLDMQQTSGYIPINTEKIISYNPDYILRISHGSKEDTKKMFDAEFDKNPAFKILTAVKNDNVFDLDSSIFSSTANLNSPIAIEELINIFYE
ncbi:MAG: ABC transporter substrate-binding protein [Oscillospiraceae bacterium]|nr:ABC transporter substrate-binding protein [Oscillospiraceae bacterium]